jgi:hypothetical protein
MPLVLQARGSSYTTSKQKHKALKLTSKVAMLNNKATQAKLESAKHLATQTKQCD